MGQRRTLPGGTLRAWSLTSVRATDTLLVVLMCSSGLSAYSVLTPEEIFDLLWTDEIQPLLLKRYPGLSPDQLKEAHAYAYGGAWTDLARRSILTSFLNPKVRYWLLTRF